MKDCPEFEALIEDAITDDIVGFFCQKKTYGCEEVRVFTLIRKSQSISLAN